MRGVAGLLLALLALALSVTVTAAAGPVNAEVGLDRTVITVGDRVQATVTVDVDRGYQVTDPGVTAGAPLGDFEVLEVLPAERQTLPNGGTRIVYQYRLTTFRLGDQRVAPIAVQYVEPTGLRGIARTDEKLVRVNSVLQGGETLEDIKPLKPVLDIPGGIPGWLLASLVAVAVALLAGLVALLILSIRRAFRTVDPDSLLTPPQRAIRELGRIEAEQLPEQGRVAEHYELVARCLRRYVFEQFGVHAPERTPRELRREMVRAGVDRYQALMIDEVLIESETVRFGRLVPSTARAHNTIRVATDVIATAEAAAEPAARDVVGAGR